MYNEFYSDPYSREYIDDNEIYLKNEQIYDNETRATIVTKKDSAPYDDLPISLQQPVNTSCRCNSCDTTLLNEHMNHGTLLNRSACHNNRSSTNDVLKSNFSNKLNMSNDNGSKFSLNISLTITEIIEILILIMIAVLIAITIRSRSRILVFKTSNTPHDGPVLPQSAV